MRENTATRLKQLMKERKKVETSRYYRLISSIL